MDSFYASVEMRDRPHLRNRPLAIGGNKGPRGIICTANYSARRYGIRSAMPTFMAQELCPNLTVLKPDMNKYRSISKNIRAIFSQYTNLIEPISLDEAYLDVTNEANGKITATLIAKEIRDNILAQEELTASAGVSINKLIAKIASDCNKPNGMTVIPPNKIEDFMLNLPVEKISGVGPATHNKLLKLGISNCAQLQKIDIEVLCKHFGKFGRKLHFYSRGIDDRDINCDRVAKSASVENTFEHNLSSLTECLNQTPLLIKKLHERLESKKLGSYINKVFVKVKFADFIQTTAETKQPCIDEICINKLLEEAYSRGLSSKVRLIGLGVRFSFSPQQIPILFDSNLT